MRRRIAATRWPSKELVEDRSQGVQLTTPASARARLGHRLRLAQGRGEADALPQFTTEIDGVDIHFIHVKSQHENALPLIMTHGWPGSVIELLETFGPLTDPTAHGGEAEDALTLFCRPCPATGSPVSRPSSAGTLAVSHGVGGAMRCLGYTRYVAQGGDAGLRRRTLGRQALQGGLAST